MVVLSILIAAAALEMPSGEPRTWSVAEVTQWVGAVGWNEYRGAFAEAQMTGPKLLQLGKKQLHDDLRIVAPEHRTAILAEIVKLGKTRRATSPPDGTSHVLEDELAALRERLAAGAGSPPVRTGPDKAVSRWSVSDVLSWLDEVGMSHAGPAFKRFKIDGRRLEELDSEEAIEAAVRGQVDRGHRITLAQELLSLKACQASD